MHFARQLFRQPCQTAPNTRRRHHTTLFFFLRQASGMAANIYSRATKVCERARRANPAKGCVDQMRKADIRAAMEMAGPRRGIQSYVLVSVRMRSRLLCRGSELR